MPLNKNLGRPEAGNDTRHGKPGEGQHERDGKSGGTRTSAGGTYGDFVPTAGQPRANDDRDATPPMGDYYTGGGNIDRIAEEPGASDRAPHAADQEPQERRAPQDRTEAEREETVAEANRNKGFDTTHVHSGTTSRKV